MPFFEKMIKERQNPMALSMLIQRLCVLNLSFSQAICRVILKCVNEVIDPKDEMDELVMIISQVLAIKDAYYMNRMEYMLGFTCPFIYDCNVMGSIDEEKFIFASSNENPYTVECLLSYIYMNRLRYFTRDAGAH